MILLIQHAVIYKKMAFYGNSLSNKQTNRLTNQCSSWCNLCQSTSSCNLCQSRLHLEVICVKIHLGGICVKVHPGVICVKCENCAKYLVYYLKGITFKISIQFTAGNFKDNDFSNFGIITRIV